MMHDQHVSSGAFVVDGLDPAERAAYVAHLDRCADCRTETASFYETLAELTLPVPTPVDQADRVRHAIALTAQHRPVTRPIGSPATVAGRSERATRPARSSWLSTAGLLAVAAAVWFVAFGIGRASRTDSTPTPVVVAQMTPDADGVDRLMTAPDAQMVLLHPSEVGDAAGVGLVRVVVSPSLGRGYLGAADLTEVGPGRTFELWVIDDDADSEPAALFVPGPDGGAGVLFAVSMDNAHSGRWAVTVEPAGGSREPTGPVHYEAGSQGTQADS